MRFEGVLKRLGVDERRLGSNRLGKRFVELLRGDRAIVHEYDAISGIVSKGLMRLGVEPNDVKSLQ